MNHWLVEELTRLSYAEWQCELDAIRLQNDIGAMRANLTFTTRAALKLSDWLIITGASLRQRYEKIAPVSAWMGNGKFVR